MTTPERLPDAFEARADQLDRYAPAAAEAFREAAALAREAWDAYCNELLTPEQVERERGCHPETVRRRVRSGEVINHGTPGKILIRRADAPAGRGKARRSIESAARGAILARIGRT